MKMVKLMEMQVELCALEKVGRRRDGIGRGYGIDFTYLADLIELYGYTWILNYMPIH